MNVAVIGDVHIGASISLGNFDVERKMESRLVDYSNTLDYIIEYCKNNNIDSVIFAGDYFKSRRPTSLHRKIFDEKIKRLSNYNIETFLITGNHDIILENNVTVLDSLEIASFPNVHIYKEFGHVILGNDKDKVNIIFAPFTNRHILNVESDEDALNAIKKLIQNEINNLDVLLPTIMVGHYIVEGAQLNSIRMTTNMRLSNELVLPQSFFKQINLTIMGHVHICHVVSKDPSISYVGSIEKTDLGEANDKKGFFVLDTKKGAVKFVNLPVRKINCIVLDANNINQLEGYNLEDSIVDIKIKCSKEKLHEVDINRVREILKNKKVHHCVSISTEPINELKEVKIDMDSMSDKELFIKYIKENFSESDDLISFGLDVMDATSEKENA